MTTRSQIYRTIKTTYPTFAKPEWKHSTLIDLKFINNVYRDFVNKYPNDVPHIEGYATPAKVSNALLERDVQRLAEQEDTVVDLEIILGLNVRSKPDKRSRQKRFSNIVADYRQIKLTDDEVNGYRKVAPLSPFFAAINTKKKIVNLIRKTYKQDFSFGTICVIYVRISTPTRNVNDWVNMAMRGNVKYLCEFSNVISSFPGNDNCVVNMVKSNNILREFAHYLPKTEDITVKQFMKFLDKCIAIKPFTYGIYDYSGTIRFGQQDADLNIISTGNHINLIDGKMLKRNENKPKDIVNSTTIEEQLKDNLDNGIIPYNLICGYTSKLSTTTIEIDPLNYGTPAENTPIEQSVFEKTLTVSMFETDKTIYINNPEYTKACDIFDILNLDKKTINYDIIDASYVGQRIARSYIKSSLDSICFPFDYQPSIPYYRCSDEKLKQLTTYKTIDKIGAYRNCLRNLKYLYVFDIFKCNTSEFDGIMKPGYLYVTQLISYTGTVPNIIMSSNGIYDRDYLIKCSNYGFTYKIISQIECMTKPNYYVNMIDDLMEKIKDAKEIINVMIGMMGMSIGHQSTIYNKYQHIVSTDEETRIDNKLSVKLTDDYYAVKTKGDQSCGIYNMQPIHIQIKNAHNMNMFEDMVKLKITKHNLIQLKTDSITFETSKNLDDFVSSNGYKYEATKLLETPHKIETTVLMNNILGKRVYGSLQSVYAGVGKTTLISTILKNKNIADIKKIMKDATPEDIYTFRTAIEEGDYSIICPTHRTKLAYDNADVITRYAEKNIVPTGKVVICDEIGLMSNQNTYRMLLECKLLGKIIICIGDFEQLPSIGGEFELTDRMKQILFTSVSTNLKKNYRNGFTEEYYDNLKHHMTNDEAIKEMNNYSTKKGDIVICMRNTIRHKYNMSRLLKYIGKSATDVKYKCITKTDGYKRGELYEYADCCDNQDFYDNFMIDDSEYIKGVKLICLTNKFQKTGVVNKSELIFDYIEDGYVHFERTTFIVPLRQFVASNFDLGYAITIYTAQGQTLHSYYWAPEDNEVVKKLDICNRICYVCVSRLDINKKCEMI